MPRPRINGYVKFIDSDTAYGLTPRNRRDEIILLMRAQGFSWTHVGAELFSRDIVYKDRSLEHWWRYIREKFFQGALKSGVIFQHIDLEPLQLPSMKNCGIILNANIRKSDEKKLRKMSRQELKAELRPHGYGTVYKTQRMISMLMALRGFERARGTRQDDYDEIEEEQSWDSQEDEDEAADDREEEEEEEENEDKEDGDDDDDEDDEIDRTTVVYRWPAGKGCLERRITNFLFPSHSSPIFESVTELGDPKTFRVVCKCEGFANALIEKLDGYWLYGHNVGVCFFEEYL